MISLTYASTANRPFDDDALATLLMNSRSTNRRLGLTGFLVHKDGQFLQVLEGPEDAVTDRFDRIAADPRHSSVSTLIRETIPARRFPEWTMGYEAMTDTLAEQIPGYRDLVSSSPLTESDAAPAVRQLVAWFRTRHTTASITSA